MFQNLFCSFLKHKIINCTIGLCQIFYSGQALNKQEEKPLTRGKVGHKGWIQDMKEGRSRKAWRQDIRKEIRTQGRKDGRAQGKKEGSRIQ